MFYRAATAMCAVLLVVLIALVPDGPFTYPHPGCIRSLEFVISAIDLF